MNQNIYDELCNITRQENIKVEEPLSKHTTFRIGGPADYFVIPESIEEIKAIVEICRMTKIPFYVIGNGSNLLVGDQGFHGVIIMIGNKISKITIEEPKIEEPKLEDNELKNTDLFIKVTAQAGVSLCKLAVEIANHSLTGFEFAAGIPGTLGGAVAMNAGAYGGEIKQGILSATVLDQKGNIKTLTKEELKLGYRTSVIQTQTYIMLEATFSFKEGKKEDIFDKIVELNSQRKQKQPLEFPSAGSTFKRPEGFYAGKLIMEAGLSGYRVGDVMISEKHCGFVVNVGDGTAEQVKTLIHDVDQIVYEKSGVHLEPEIRMIGEF